MLNSNSTALLSTLRKQHHIFSTFAPDEDDVENCRTLEFKSKLRHELSSKEQEKIDVYTGISTDEKKKDKHVKDMRIFSATSEEFLKEIENTSSSCISQKSQDTTRSEDHRNLRLVDNGHDRFIDESYEIFPDGTPRLAALQSSSNSLAIWRRFSRIHCRLLQRLQNQITMLEQQLDMLDKKDANTEMRYRLVRNDWHENWDRRQEDLLDELKAKLSEYDDLLVKDSQLRRLTPAPPRDHLHLFNWIFGTKPLDEGHYNFILHQYDFVSLSNLTRTSNGVDKLIEWCLSRWPTSPFQYFFRTANNSKEPCVHFFSLDKIAFVARLITLCIAVIILLIPIFLFSLLDLSKKITLIIVVVFTLLFSIMISGLAGESMESVFIGTCTYAAVLVTFLGNVHPN